MDSAINTTAFKCVHEHRYEGVRVLAPEQHIAIAASHTNRALRSTRRGVKVLKHTRANELTLDQRTAHSEATAHVAAIAGVAKVEKDKLLKLTVGANPQLPRASDLVNKLEI